MLELASSARRMFGLLRPERRGVVVVIVLSVVAVILNALGPRLLGHGTDLIFDGFIGSRLPEGLSKDQAIEQLRSQGRDAYAGMLAGMDVVPGQGVEFDALQWALLGVLMVYLGASAFTWQQGYLLNNTVQRTMLRLRGDVEAKLNRLPMRYFDTNPRGEVLSRVTNDINNISDSMTQMIGAALTWVLTIVGVLTMMVVISPLLALISLVIVPMVVAATAAIAKRSRKEFVAQWARTGELNAQIEEVYTAHTLVTVFGRQPEVEKAFRAKNDELFEAGFRSSLISGMIQPVMMLLGSLNYVIIAVVGALRVTSGSMSLGEVQAFIQYSQQFSMPLSQLAGLANLLQSGVASAERVFDLLDEPEQTPEAEEPATVPESHGRVEFDHVSFSYDQDSPLIEALSVTAEPCATVAIVGRTGAGKTTLANLIMRFYELRAGRITLDGQDISELRRSDLRSQLGMVDQDSWLFSGTIRENISYGDPDATEEAIMDAARATHVDRIARSLPDGYDTVINEEGDNLSAGEKQLITIARAFLADRDVLILDEATSSLDTRTERLVQQAMAAMRADRTSLVIAHRLSTVRDADVILVMEAGDIVEQGSHAELLDRRGAYYAIYKNQFTTR